MDKVKQAFNNNKGPVAVLVVVFVCYGTYCWFLYREYQKKKDIYQNKKIANTCPDYWQNVSTKDKDGKISLKCKNVHKHGKYFLTGDQTYDFGKDLYKDPINKCKFAKYANISWEGIDNLCADVSD